MYEPFRPTRAGNVHMGAKRKNLHIHSNTGPQTTRPLTVQRLTAQGLYSNPLSEINNDAGVRLNNDLRSKDRDELPSIQHSHTINGFVLDQHISKPWPMKETHANEWAIAAPKPRQRPYAVVQPCLVP